MVQTASSTHLIALPTTPSPKKIRPHPLFSPTFSPPFAHLSPISHYSSLTCHPSPVTSANPLLSHPPFLHNTIPPTSSISNLSPHPHPKKNSALNSHILLLKYLLPYKSWMPPASLLPKTCFSRTPFAPSHNPHPANTPALYCLKPPASTLKPPDSTKYTSIVP